MEQWKLVIEYVKEYGKITPAKLPDRKYRDGFFGSDTPKRCRELFAKGLLCRIKEGKFKTFYPTEKFFSLYKPKVILKTYNEPIEFEQESLFNKQN